MKKRIISIMLAICMVLSFVPITAVAAGGAPSLSSFATKNQLMTEYMTDSDGKATNIGKLVFGKNNDNEPQEWYILGKDTGVSGDNVAVFTSKYMSSSQVFNPNPNKKYSESKLRTALNNMATSNFTSAEQAMMNATTVKTDDYTTSDKLYPLGGGGHGAITIKAGSSDQIVLDINSYLNGSNGFWLRMPSTSMYSLFIVYKGAYVGGSDCRNSHEVRPAGNLNLSSVLFASSATASTNSVSAGTLSSDKAMTLRKDGSAKAIGTVRYGLNSIVANKDSNASGTVSLVVQGNDGTNDWYYSIPVGQNTVVSADQIIKACNISSIYLSECKIWLEVTDSSDNFIYAKMATSDTYSETYSNPQKITNLTEPVAGEALDTQATFGGKSVPVTYTSNGVTVTGIADWNKTYTAKIIISQYVSYNQVYLFYDPQSVSINGGLDGSFALNTDGTLTVTKDYTTAKRKIVSLVSAPTAPSTFTTYYDYSGYGNILTNGGNGELGKQAKVQFEGTAAPTTADMNVVWTVANANNAAYDKTPGATNTFRWTIPASELTNYNAENCPGYSSGTITGTVTIKNKSATAVTITGTDGTVNFTGSAIDVSRYFNIDKNAGAATYSIVTEGTTGEGTLSGSNLTVTKTGTFKIKVNTAVNGVYASGEKTVTLTVANGTIQFTASDFSGAYDGKAHGIDLKVSSPAGATVTYSTDGTTYSTNNPSFTEVGNYTVYYRIEKANYNTINGQSTVSITNDWVPSEYTASVPNANGWLNGNFVITAADGYKISSSNTANGTWSKTLTFTDETPDGSATFYLKNDASGAISLAKTVTYKIDKTPATGKVEFSGKNSWQEFVGNVTFDLYYNNEATFKAEASDSLDGSGVASIEYYASDRKMTLDEVRAITDWANYGGSFGVTVEDEKQFVYYVRITDKAGNVTYLSTNGAEYDITVPAINGAESGKTYYTTQIVTVSDKNIDVITLNGEKVSGNITLDGNRDTAYTVVATDKAGNETSVTFTMKPISEISEPIDALTTDNVKSSDSQTISDVKAAVAAVDTANATDSEKEALKAITDKASELENVIDDTKAEMNRIGEAINGYSEETVKSSDAPAIGKLVEDIKALTDADNITADERANLEKLCAKAENLLAKIAETKAEYERIIAAANGYDEATVTSADKDDLIQLNEDIYALAISDNATSDELQNLDAAHDKVFALIDKLIGIDDEITAVINRVVETVNKSVLEGVNSSDKSDIEQLVEDIGVLLESTNISEDERTLLENANEICGKLIAKINATAEEINRINSEANAYDSDTVTSEDRADIEKLIADTKALTDGNGITDAEREQLNGNAAALEALLDEIEATAEEINRINNATNAYDADTVTSEDRADIEKLIADTKALTDGNGITDAEREQLNGNAATLEALIAEIDAAGSLVDAIGIELEQFDENRVTIFSKDDIEALKAKADELLADGNMGEAEKAKLNEYKAQADKLIEIIKTPEMYFSARFFYLIYDCFTWAYNGICSLLSKIF